VITTEAILTTAAGFGLDEATPVQRARCRIGDGLPLGDLRDCPEVVQMVGGPEALKMLPSEEGIAPELVIDLSSIRSAKTLMALASGIRAAQLVSVDGLKRGEVPRVALMNLKLERAHVAYGVLVATLRASRVLRPLLVGEPTADSVMLRHPEGPSVEIAPVAGAKAGAGLVGDWSAGFIADEAPRMNGSADGSVVNLNDALNAIAGRLLPGAQIRLIGSPHAPSGPVYDLVGEHWRKPSPAVVVLRSTGPQNNPRHWTPARCAKLEQTNPAAYQTDVMGEFADLESGLLSPISVRQCTREEPLELLPENGAAYAAAVDLAEGSAGGNPISLVVVEAIEADEEKGEPPFFKVVLAREWRGLGPNAFWTEIASCCNRYGIDRLSVDQYAASANAEIARRHGLELDVRPWTSQTRMEAFTNLATIVHSNRIELSPDRTFRRDLLSVKRRTTQSGQTIVLPKTSDGRHCDFAPALAAALRSATQHAGASDLFIGGYASDWRR
jgi:hypothetical protein